MSEVAIRRTVLTGVLLATPAVFSLRVPDDPDLFWHLRVGAWVVEHRAVPALDPFSTWGADKPWVAYSWLFEVLAHLVHAAGGLTGIVAATALAWVVLAALLLRLVQDAEPRFPRAAALAGLGMVALLRLASPRPWLFTIGFFLIEISALLAVRRTGQLRKALWLPLLFALWANLHIQFVYGLLPIGLLALEALVERRRGGLAFLPVLALGAACALATLANPYGVGVWRVVLEYATQTGAFENVSELRALEFRSIPDWGVLGCVLAGALGLGWRRERRLFPYLLLAAGAACAFRAGRDAWFGAIAGIAAAADMGAVAALQDRFRPGKLARAALVLGIPLVLGLVGLARGLREPALEAAIAAKFPAAACAFVESRSLPGPLYNDFDWGGYLIWRLPRLKVAIDGRTNLHGDERIAHSIATWSGRPGWSVEPDLTAARLVIAPAGASLTDLLRADARFEVAHEDPVAVVFTRIRGESGR